MTPAASWSTVLLAGLLAYLLKLAGYLLPGRLLLGRRTARVTARLPVALLAALVAIQTFTTATGSLTLDARAAGLLVAVLALLRRANFLLVVVLAAATAAALRGLGWAH